MIDLPYSLVIGDRGAGLLWIFLAGVGGLLGIGPSIEDCLYLAKWGMREHLALLNEQKLPVPKASSNPTVTIKNEASAQKHPRPSTAKRKAKV